MPCQMCLLCGHLVAAGRRAGCSAGPPQACLSHALHGHMVMSLAPLGHLWPLLTKGALYGVTGRRLSACTRPAGELGGRLDPTNAYHLLLSLSACVRPAGALGGRLDQTTF